MNSELVDQLTGLGANGLPYIVPIHPNLVHLTLGLFIVAIAFDIVGMLYPFEQPVFKYLSIPATRSNFYDVGWYNMLAAAIVTFFTVAAGFFEIMLARPDPEVTSAWGLMAMKTLLWHGVGGVVLLVLIVGMAIWRGFQRFYWRKDMGRQVQWGYIMVGLLIFGLMFAHGTLGAHLGGQFGVANTAAQLLRMGKNPNAVL
jgi:uncharacterized membrane protein